MTYTNSLSFIAGSHFAYALSCCLLCSCSCFHSWNSFRPSSLWKKAMISGRKVLTIASSSCFGTPLFVSVEGGTSSIWISFLSVCIVAIRQRFYICRSFLLLDSDRLCPLGDRFVIHFSSEIWFFLFGKYNWKWNSLMCQVGWHTRLWICWLEKQQISRWKFTRVHICLQLLSKMSILFGHAILYKSEPRHDWRRVRICFFIRLS